MLSWYLENFEQFYKFGLQYPTFSESCQANNENKNFFKTTKHLTNITPNVKGARLWEKLECQEHISQTVYGLIKIKEKLWPNGFLFFSHNSNTFIVKIWSKVWTHKLCVKWVQMDAVHNWWCYHISVKSLSSSAAIELGMIPVCLHASLQTGEWGLVIHDVVWNWGNL